jgi:hypothetical protein
MPDMRFKPDWQDTLNMPAARGRTTTRHRRAVVDSRFGVAETSPRVHETAHDRTPRRRVRCWTARRARDRRLPSGTPTLPPPATSASRDAADDEKRAKSEAQPDRDPTAVSVEPPVEREDDAFGTRWIDYQAD